MYAFNQIQINKLHSKFFVALHVKYVVEKVKITDMGSRSKNLSPLLKKHCYSSNNSIDC